MYVGGLRKIVNDGLFVPRDTSKGATIVDIQSGAFIVPLEWSYTRAHQFEDELIKLFQKYGLVTEDEDIKSI